jgi:hypothetical protein
VLSTTEWWYNTSLKTTPFQALYGFAPPMITENILSDAVGQEARDMLMVKQSALQTIKNNLHLAWERMKKQADKEEVKRHCKWGTWPILNCNDTDTMLWASTNV